MLPPVSADATATPAGEGFALSVCICTRNRPEELTLALRSVQRSSVPVHEVIVSDDSTDRATRELIEQSFPTARWVEGPRVGLGANRNRALEAATGTHVLFIDDDVELGVDFVARIRDRWRSLAPASRDQTILAGTESQRGREVWPNEQGFLGFQNRPYRPEEPLRTVVINGTVFPRNLFTLVQFDPQLVYGYDEVDLTTRAVAAGYGIEACFDAVNVHSPSPVNRQYYAPYIAASRLYVTAKRRRHTEARPWAATVFLVVASLHVLVSAIKRDRLGGLRSAVKTLRTARGYRRAMRQPSTRTRGHRLSTVRQILLRPLLRGVRGERALAAALMSASLRPASRFVLREVAHRGGDHAYRLRGSGLRLVFRHRSADLATFAEVFGHRDYELPGEVAERLAALAHRPTVVDLGANAGFFSVFMLDQLGRPARIVAFEADPRSFSALRRCADLNPQAAEWELHAAAASSRDGTLAFVADGTPSARVAGNAAHGATIDVPAVDVFPIMASADLVKVDIEGAEWELLDDERLAGVEPVAVVIEHHPLPGEDARATAAARLERAGFRVIPGRDTGGGHGLLWGVR
jgi:FkbM family methyltransferase